MNKRKAEINSKRPAVNWIFELFEIKKSKNEIDEDINSDKSWIHGILSLFVIER